MFIVLSNYIYSPNHLWEKVITTYRPIQTRPEVPGVRSKARDTLLITVDRSI